MSGELSETRSDALGHPFCLSDSYSILLSWRFASPDRGVRGWVRLGNSRLDLEMISSPEIFCSDVSK